jgi:hypothetical protein
MRCRFISSQTECDDVVSKARNIIRKLRLKRKFTLPDYANPSDIRAWWLYGMIDYDTMLAVEGDKSPIDDDIGEKIKQAYLEAMDDE